MMIFLSQALESSQITDLWILCQKRADLNLDWCAMPNSSPQAAAHSGPLAV